MLDAYGTCNGLNTLLHYGLFHGFSERVLCQETWWKYETRTDDMSRVFKVARSSTRLSIASAGDVATKPALEKGREIDAGGVSYIFASEAFKVVSINRVRQKKSHRLCGILLSPITHGVRFETAKIVSLQLSRSLDCNPPCRKNEMRAM